MATLLKRYVREESGQDLIEYLLLGTLIGVVVVAGASLLGVNVNTWYTTMGGWVSTQEAAIP